MNQFNVSVQKTNKLAPLPFHGSEQSAGFDIKAFFLPNQKLNLPNRKLKSSGRKVQFNLESTNGIQTLLKTFVTISPGERILIPTGLKFQPPRGIHFEIFGRSGLALKGIQPFTGIIDQDFRGELGVVLFNMSDEKFTIKGPTFVVNHHVVPMGYFERFAEYIKEGKVSLHEDGDRIAQLLFRQTFFPSFHEVENLEETERGSGSFGSTGGVFHIGKGKMEDFKKAWKDHMKEPQIFVSREDEESDIIGAERFKQWSNPDNKSFVQDSGGITEEKKDEDDSKKGKDDLQK